MKFPAEYCDYKIPMSYNYDDGVVWLILTTKFACALIVYNLRQKKPC